MKIAKETWIIMAIGLADLATTILFIQHHGAEEANPLFRQYWEMGLAAFIAAKIVLLVGPLSILEWARQRRPRLVSWALRGAIAAYVLMYGVGYIKLNHSAAREIDMADLNAPAVHLEPRLSGRFAPALRTVKQSSAAERHVAGDISVTVY